MSNFNIEDVVLVYKDTPTFKDGTIAQIIDRDGNEPNEYLVADLRDIGKANRDINVILNRYGKWVKSENMHKLYFDKPKESKFIKRSIITTIILTIGLGILFNPYYPLI